MGVQQRRGSGLSLVWLWIMFLYQGWGLEQTMPGWWQKTTAFPVKPWENLEKANRKHSAMLPGTFQRTCQRHKKLTTRSMSEDYRCSPPRPRRREANAPVWYPDHLPPCRTGRFACNHWISEMSVLEIRLRADMRVVYYYYYYHHHHHHHHHHHYYYITTTTTTTTSTILPATELWLVGGLREQAHTSVPASSLHSSTSLRC